MVGVLRLAVTEHQRANNSTGVLENMDGGVVLPVRSHASHPLPNPAFASVISYLRLLLTRAL